MPPPNVRVQLGSFVFRGMEVPAEIIAGGDQMLVVHKLPGGKRIIDSMGRDDKDLEWSGRFLGSDAVPRALLLDSLRIIGKPLPLTWFRYRYAVVIRSFTWTYEFAYNVPYSISCVVVADAANPTPGTDKLGPDAAIRGASGLISKASGFLKGATDFIKAGVDKVTGFITDITDFINAPLDQIKGLISEVNNLQTFVTDTISTTAFSLGNIANLGGILPNQVGNSIINIGNQAINTTNLPSLYTISNGLGVIDTNVRTLSGLGGATAGKPDVLSSVASVPRTIGDVGGNVLVVGGNLFDYAQQAYGDANKWVGIAKANKISDPFIVGEKTLVIPKNSEELKNVS